MLSYSYGFLDESGKPSQSLRTLFLQETDRSRHPDAIACGGLRHGDEDIDRTVEAIDGALGVDRRALEGWRGKIPLRPPVATCL